MIPRTQCSAGIGHQQPDGGSPDHGFIAVYSRVIGSNYHDSEVTIIRMVHGKRGFRPVFGEP